MSIYSPKGYKPPQSRIHEPVPPLALQPVPDGVSGKDGFSWQWAADVLHNMMANPDIKTGPNIREAAAHAKELASQERGGGSN